MVQGAPQCRNDPTNLVAIDADEDAVGDAGPRGVLGMAIEANLDGKVEKNYYRDAQVKVEQIGYFVSIALTLIQKRLTLA